MKPAQSNLTAAPTAEQRRVVIVGGGITGLSAGWAVQQAASEGNVRATYTILEASARWGGKILTEQIDGFGDAPFVLEAGADALLTRKPWALELARELGLAERILPVNRAEHQTYLLHNGTPTPLPEGLNLLVPTKIAPFLRSPLFTAQGKLRALLDGVIPARKSDDDETLGAFVRRRLGAEMLDKLGEPLLGGIFNGDPEQQSICATFPQFPALERQHGSLMRGMSAAQQKRRTSDEAAFISFERGLQELVTALVGQLRGDLRLETGVERIEQADGRYRVVTTSGEVIEADAVILTTPAQVTATLLRQIAPQASDSLREIGSSSIGTAYCGFRREDVPHAPQGFGLVIPRSERRPIDGMTWSSSKWQRRAPRGHVLIRVFFGGPRTRATLELDDGALSRVLRGELESILGITAAPLFERVYRWRDAYPQYNVGHEARVAAAEAALPPHLLIAGSAYRGVGVPDCVRQGREAGTKAVEQLREQFGIEVMG